MFGEHGQMRAVDFKERFGEDALEISEIDREHRFGVDRVWECGTLAQGFDTTETPRFREAKEKILESIEEPGCTEKCN